MNLQIIRGKLPSALFVTLYGCEGIGKSTLASRFPNPLFIDLESSTIHMDVNRIKTPDTWDLLIETIHMIADDPDVCKTLVIDTADKAEEMCIKQVCKMHSQSSIEGWGYGKGYVILAEEFSRLLKALDDVISSGKHVVIIAHAKMRKFEQPDEMGAYDRWELKLTRQVAPLLKERSDMLLFLNYKTFVVTSGNTRKAQGGKRVMYASHHPCWDAKNRFGLPEEMDLDYQCIAPLFKEEEADAEPQEEPLKRLRTLMAGNSVTDEELQQVVSERGKCPADLPVSGYSETICDWCERHWSKIIDTINTNRENGSSMHRKEAYDA